MQESRRFSYPFTVKEHHLDTFGHVNHATVLQILEEARWELLSEQGYGLASIRRDRQGPVILEVNVKYRKEMLLRRSYTITTWTSAYQRKIGQLEQVIATPEGETAVTATLTVGLFDLERRKLIEPTPVWLQALGIHDAAHAPAHR